MKIISPKYDFCFKELMENPIVRKYFISDILDLPVEEIQETRLLNTFLRKRYRKQKLGILDILVELKDGTRINIEMQARIQDAWDKRSIFYLAKTYAEPLVAGENYSRLNRCIHISLLDYNLTEGEEYHSVYRLRDKKGSEYSNLLEVHVIEFKKKLRGNDRVDDWIRFFNAANEEELDMIKEKNPGLREAVRELKEMSLTRRMRLIYEARQKEIRDRNAEDEYLRKHATEEGYKNGFQSGIEWGMEQGIEQGMEQGIEQGIKAVTETCQQLAVSREDTRQLLIEKFSVSGERAQQLLGKFWRNP